MSIEEIERYLQELEAIKNYPQVKQDRGMLSRKIEELNVSLDNALREVSSLKKSKAKLDGAEMTLEEARLDFIQAQDAEIEKRAADRFQWFKKLYEEEDVYL
jgi:transcriptional/translational regulatory protein YebC/TACO1